MKKAEKYSKILSNEFIFKIKEFTAGHFDETGLEELIAVFEKANDRYYVCPSLESNLIRIIASAYNRISLLRDCLKYPKHIETMLAIAANSNYLTDIVVLNPEYLEFVLQDDLLLRRYDDAAALREINLSISKYRTFSAKVNLLRSVKRREILRIGVCDILGYKGLEEVTAQLSSLARAINSSLFSLCYHEVMLKYPIAKPKENFCLIALGKLGGGELNYSSDVDFILFYEKDSLYKKITKRTYREILTETVQLFSRTSMEASQKGFIYRIDFRLRPYGKSAPLCLPMKDYLGYYENRADAWEKQMLIKASFVCGRKKLFSSFYNFVEYLIYPSVFLDSTVRNIAVMKKKIEMQPGIQDNIKLFSGGIRDIEFPIQGLQMINGGHNKDLRTGHTLQALKRLTDSGLLNAEEFKGLHRAYIFYRRIEHYLQLMNDTQTHTLPAEGESIEKMSRYFGYQSPAGFLDELNRQRQFVRNFYDSFTGEGHDKLKLEDIIFQNVIKAKRDFNFLKAGQGVFQERQFDQKTTASFMKLEDNLLGYLKNSSFPDEILDNFAKVIRGVKFPSIWYDELSNNKFLRAFLRLCEFSEKSISMMISDPKIAEMLISRSAFTSDADNYLQAFTPQQVSFMCTVQYSLGLIDYRGVAGILSSYIKNKIISLFNRSGFPDECLLLCLGSTATGEMNFQSDIDLVFLSSNFDDIAGLEHKFRDFLLEINRTLKPFTADSRLRPEGKNSQLVWGLSDYLKYLNSRARTWEFQSLCKLNILAGSNEMYNKLNDSIFDRIKMLTPEALRADILTMRQKMAKEAVNSLSGLNIKRGSGGLVELEFPVQFYLLCNPQLYCLMHGKNTEDIIRQVEIFNYISENYSFLKDLLLKLQLLFNSSGTSIPRDKNQLKKICIFTGFAGEKEFLEQITKVMDENIAFFNSWLVIPEGIQSQCGKKPVINSNNTISL